MSTEWCKIESAVEKGRNDSPIYTIEVVTSSRGLYLFIKPRDKETGVKFDLTKETAESLIGGLTVGVSVKYE